MECADSSCPASAVKRGYCERHYRQARRRGEVGWDGTPCEEDGCSSPALARGLCQRHYQAVLGVERGTCAIDGCEKPIFGREWCQTHYARWNRHGDPLAWKKPKRQICSVGGCDLAAVGNGLCDLHYRRVRRYGSPDVPPRPVRIDPSPFTCKQCGSELPKLRRGRRSYCSDGCRQAWEYWDRREKHRAKWLKQYGLTVEQFETLLAEQDNRCAICRTDELPKRGSWHVDHNHVTGRVRGILCHGCNVSLGHFRDRIDLLEAAVAYLKRE